MSADMRKAFEGALMFDYVKMWRQYPDLFNLDCMTKAEKASIFHDNRKLYDEMGFDLTDLPVTSIFEALIAGRPSKQISDYGKTVLNTKQFNFLAYGSPSFYLRANYPIDRVTKYGSIKSLHTLAQRYKKYHSKLKEIESRYKEMLAPEFKKYVLKNLDILNNMPIGELTSKVPARTLILELGGVRTLYDTKYYETVTLSRFNEIVEDYFADTITGESKLIITAQNAITRFRQAKEEYENYGQVVKPPEYHKSVKNSKRLEQHKDSRWNYLSTYRNNHFRKI